MNPVSIVTTILYVYLLCLLVWALMSWIVQLSPGTAYNPYVRKAQRFLDSIVMPYTRLFQFIKPVRLGGGYLDLSFLAAMISLIIVINILGSL
ncbi:MAG: YggT family protein [Thermoleophilia bacterium]|nr:YggT family protein [Thermoleophilia bacterium]